jgi:uncharacterized protein YPO0396
MKLLTRIRLINWHLFENATISCQGTTYFIGVNGAGKSTVLDAVQFALVGGQRDVRFNQAALSGGKRTLASYVRGELGTEGQRFLRGDATGVVALEFKNPDGTFFAHGAVIDAYEDGRNPDLVYFIVNNAALNDAWFFKGAGQLHDSRSFKRSLENFALPHTSRAQVFTRLEDYRVHLLNRLGQLKDTFLAKIVKGLAFSPLTDIRSFVHTYLLDEALVDVKTLQAQLETLHHFEVLAADVRQRIDALNRIDAHDKERSANRRRRITNSYVARRGKADLHMADLQNRRMELDGLKLEFTRTGHQHSGHSRNLQFAQTALTDAEIALRSDQTTLRERELREGIARLTLELNEVSRRKIDFDRSFARELADARNLDEFLSLDQLETPAGLSSFLAQQAAVTRESFAELQSAFSALAACYAHDEALLSEKVNGLRSEAGALESEIRKLRTGDREISIETEAPNSAKLRQLIRAQLGLAADEVTYLCHELKIPAESWQDAVEGLLGFNRFTLLVPPTHYRAALEIYRQHKNSLHGAALLDSAAILKQEVRVAQPGALAAEVVSANPAVQAFVTLLLGSYLECESLDELRQYRTAITRECFVRRNYTDSHLNPQVYRRWFIGERAAARQIEQRQQRLDEIATEMIELNARASGLRERLALTRDKIRPLTELEAALPVLSRLGPLETELVSMKDELSRLDTRSMEALKAEVDRCRLQFVQTQDEVNSIARALGKLEEKILQAETEVIPGLERAADEALREADAFLIFEQADAEMTTDVQKEYARRVERQPLELVQQNAQKYENEYQNAELRSRDHLREAKQAYSLKYDFGYDETEDATRYMEERKKLVDSELPNYESQIARQRGLAEQELVENFIHRLREQIEDARQQLAFLNGALAHLRFGGERFEFITQPSPQLRQVYDMVMDSQQIMGGALFESDFRQKHQQGWDLLLERLTRPHEADEELHELQDYRNYLQYDIRIHYPNGDRALLSQINAKKSGGETTTPFYVAMAASFAQAYRLNQPRPSDTIRLAMFDEAFSKMDTARTASALQFMRQAGLQVLLATPPDKSGSLLPHVDSVRTVVRKENHSFVIPIDKDEMIASLEKE